jgi:hypothetical protein
MTCDVDSSGSVRETVLKFVRYVYVLFILVMFIPCWVTKKTGMNECKIKDWNRGQETELSGKSALRR